MDTPILRVRLRAILRLCPRFRRSGVDGPRCVLEPSGDLPASVGPDGRWLVCARLRHEGVALGACFQIQATHRRVCRRTPRGRYCDSELVFTDHFTAPPRGVYFKAVPQATFCTHMFLNGPMWGLALPRCFQSFLLAPPMRLKMFILFSCTGSLTARCLRVHEQRGSAVASKVVSWVGCLDNILPGLPDLALTIGECDSFRNHDSSVGGLPSQGIARFYP